MRSRRRLSAPRAVVAAVVLMSIPAAVGSQTGGRADFTRYVAIGDSYGAGVVNASLHRDAQVNSYPALIYRQARGATQGFEQPLVSDPGIPGVLQLRGLAPLVLAPKPGLGQPLNLTLARPYNNLSVPGFEVNEAVNTVSDDGGPADLVLRRLGTQWQQALALQPTFITVWIGGNDLLEAVLTGVVIDGVTLTTAASFERDYRTLIGALAASGAGLALGNFPLRIDEVPYATAIPPVVTDPTGRPVEIGGRQVPLVGPQGPLSSADRVLLTAAPLLARGVGIPAEVGGTGRPLPDEAVLSAAEIARIQERLVELSGIVESVAREFGAALVDFDPLWGQWLEGLRIGGIDFSAEFLTGGTFGLDGFHPSPLGYALIANAFIAAINDRFSTDIPPVGLGEFVFGEAGAYPGGISTAALGAQLRVKRKTFRNLRYLLGLPSPKALRRLAAQQSPP